MAATRRTEWTLQTICQDLRRRILVHGFIDNQFPGEGAVARHYGVPIRTARHAIATLVEEGLLLARRRHPCRVRPTAVEMLTERGTLLSRVVMVAWPSEPGREAFADHVANGVHQWATPRGIDFELIRLKAGEGEPRLERLRAAAGQTAGWMLLHARLGKDLLQRWLTAGAPVVLVEAPPAPVRVNVAAFDYESAGMEAADHLLALGHRQIACLTPDGGAAASEAALRGVRLAFQRRQVPVPIEYVAATPQALLRLEPRPTGIVCLSAPAAEALMAAADAENLAVPAALSVMAIRVQYSPAPRQDPVSGIDLGRPEQLGESALELLTRPEATFQPATILLRGQLHNSQTTAPPP